MGDFWERSGPYKKAIDEPEKSPTKWWSEESQASGKEAVDLAKELCIHETVRAKYTCVPSNDHLQDPLFVNKDY